MSELVPIQHDDDPSNGRDVAGDVSGEWSPATSERYDDAPPVLDAESVADGLADADRHLAEVRRLRHMLGVLEGIYDAEIRRIEQRWAERKTMLTRRINWHLEPVRQLHERLVDEAATSQTLELPNGTIVLRVPRKAKVWITEPDRVREWARQSRPELLPPVSKVSVTELRHIAAATDDGRAVDIRTGEIIPGATSSIPEPTWRADTEPGQPF